MDGEGIKDQRQKVRSPTIDKSAFDRIFIVGISVLKRKGSRRKKNQLSSSEPRTLRSGLTLEQSAYKGDPA